MLNRAASEERVARPLSELLKLDLSRVHCTDLQVTASLPLDDAQLDAVRGLIKEVGQPEQWPWLFDTSYVVKRRAHSISADLHPTRHSGVYHLLLAYSVGRDWLYKPSASLDRLFELVDTINSSVKTKCEVHFRYSENDGVSQIPLPLTVSPVRVSELRVEARGIRLALLDSSDGVESFVIVDRPRNRDYSHLIGFERQSISSRLPAEALEYATGLSRTLFSFTRKQRRRQKDQDS